jgi:hypothetical protein
MTTSRARRRGKADDRPRVLILGGGFAGLAAATELRADRFDVTLVDRRRAFEFLPNIHELLSGVKSPELLRLPLDEVVERAGHRFVRDTVTAIDRLRTRGIAVYNQLVYTFFISRRFEAASLRRILTKTGIDPYYTFNTKGKEETSGYRVPIARLLQEQKEEARLLPGLTRTDEAVFNVPGLGKNYLRNSIQRDLISILPDGARLYEFHPWEKNISNIAKTHLSEDVPILDYLQRLDALGENIHDYGTIWYYY